MVYMDMKGAVTLKANANMRVVDMIINELRAIEFTDNSIMDIQLKGKNLTVSAEGTIVESYSLRTLLEKLQGQLSESSVISITRTRWETLVLLKTWQSNLKLRLQSKEQLACAQ